jgi:serine/threonine-protein kinase
MPIETGQTLLHYRLVEKIGAGGMGEVYLAEDTRLNRKVALKVLPGAMAADPSRLQRFQREAEVLAALDHPNIVSIHSIEKSGEIHFLTMGLVEGQSLDRLMAGDGLDLDRLFSVALPVTDALSAAHDKGIIHRDLKPGNIMVGRDGRVKVLDFGLAKVAETREPSGEQAATATMTSDGIVVGTMPYMSPEQIEGRAVDQRSDLFSLGIILYEMATGGRPFKGESSAALISSIMRDSPPSVTDTRTDLPRHLARIVRRCLEKNPRDRYQTARDVHTELKGLREELRTDSAASSPQTTLPLERRKRWVPAAVVGGVVLALLVVLWATRVDDQPSGAPVVEAATAGEREMIVVLPFENLGPPEDTYFAAGMTSEITSRLAEAGDLGVISRKSALQYAGTDKTIAQIGEELGVGYVLTGTVLWAREPGGASRVRIIPQLIQVRDDTHLWSQRYERKIEDIFAVQSEIAVEVTEQLGITLMSPAPSDVIARWTANLDAYQAYQRGIEYTSRTDPYVEEDPRLAAHMFARAVELDPEFAIAHAQLSMAYAVLYEYGHDRTDERLSATKAAADRALELQPDLPEGHLALAHYYYRGHRDYERALEELAIADRGLPNDTRISATIAVIEMHQGRFDDAAKRFTEALEANPRDAELVHWIADAYFYPRRYDEAERYFDLSISLAPDQVLAYACQAENLWRKGDPDERALAVLEAMPRRADARSIRFWFRHHLLTGDYAGALEELESLPKEIIEGPTWFMPKAQLAGNVYNLLGQADLARASYAAARELLEAEVLKRHDDDRVRSALGMTYAALGMKEEAIREGKRAVELVPVSKDAIDGPARLSDMAAIYVMVGEHDAAVDLIEQLLSIPSDISVPLLRLEPIWRPLFDHPRFKQLIGEP